MILKIDHIAFCSARFEADVQRFESVGYTVQFKEKGLRDLENKRPFMREFSGELDMALLLRAGSIGIELLNHGHTIEEPSYVLPVLEGQATAREPGGDTFSFNGSSFAQVSNGPENFFVDENGANDFRCDKVVVEAEDIPTAARFWGRLGFKPLAVEERAASLEFRSFLGGGTVRMFLRKSAGTAPRCWLDGYGFNCLAFFSSDAAKDRKHFTEFGMNPTEPNSFRVNGKDLRIYWVRGPAGEVAEVIGLP